MTYKRKIVVSVVMITYNHDQFIQEAINSVLMQNCNFNVELIIADDCSPDNTEKIVRRIIEEHPNSSWINYTRHSQNKGPNKNSVWILNQAAGKYIAVCEGDDYWTDPLKLQKQVDFLEANPNFVAAIHYVKTIYDFVPNSGKQIYLDKKLPDILYHKFFLTSFSIATDSLIFRNGLINYKTLELYNHLVRDKPLMIILSTFGPYKVLPDIMSVYRRQKSGISENISVKEIYNEEIAMANQLNLYLDDFFWKSLFIKSYWYRFYLSNCTELSFKNKLILFFKFMILSFYDFPHNFRDIFSAMVHLIKK